jgi:hypothetical protein
VLVLRVRAAHDLATFTMSKQGALTAARHSTTGKSAFENVCRCCEFVRRIAVLK